jgi:uncharacterized membrane protein YqaE (UPF0057 family)
VVILHWVNGQGVEQFIARPGFASLWNRAGSPAFQPRSLHEPEHPMGNLLRVLLAILLPPVGVFFTVGLGGQFWLNILLTIFGYIPGIVHAVWIIARQSR